MPYSILKRHLCNIVLFLSVTGLFISCKQNTKAEANPWGKMDAIIENVIPPTFPDKSFNILEFGAVSDSITDNTEAFARAIKKCADEGGGKVVVPKGKYLTGPIHLLDNVNLHLERGSFRLKAKSLYQF